MIISLDYKITIKMKDFLQNFPTNSKMQGIESLKTYIPDNEDARTFYSEIFDLLRCERDTDERPEADEFITLPELIKVTKKLVIC